MQLKPLEEKKAKERQGTRTDLNIVAKSPPSEGVGKTREKLAEKARVGQKRISQGDYILHNAPEIIKHWWRTEEISTNRAYELTKALSGATYR